MVPKIVLSAGRAPQVDTALDTAVQRLLRAFANDGQQRHIVGLVGLPGAGKSTLAARLVAAINQRHGVGSALALGMDGFHLTRAQLAQCDDPAAALARRGAPWTFDPQGLAERLRAIRAMPHPTPTAKGEIRWPGFMHGVGDPAPDAIAVPARTRLVLLEGLYLLHRSDGWHLDGLLDTCWYLDVGLDAALERVTQRHMASWGMERAQAWARVQANDRLNALLVAATRERADWYLPASSAGL